VMYPPNCVTCGQFVNPTKPGTSGRMHIPQDYWNGPEGEQYRCARCTNSVGPIPASHGARPDTAWVVTP